MGCVQLRYFTEQSILHTDLENSKSTATAVRLVPALAEGRNVSDTYCHRQEIPASQSSR